MGFLKTVLVLLIAFAVFTLGDFLYKFVLTWDRLDVKKIDVIGAKIVKPVEVKSFLNQSVGKNIFSYKLDKKKVASERWIKEAKIVRDFPDRIIVKIKERSPLAVFSANGKKFVLAADGWILNKVARAEKIYKLPSLSGFAALSEKKKNQIREFLRDFRSEEVNFYRRVRRFSCSGNSLKMIFGKFTVLFGSPRTDELAEKINAVEKILDDVKKKSLAVEYVDLSPFTRKTQSAIIKIKKVVEGNLKRENVSGKSSGRP